MEYSAGRMLTGRSRGSSPRCLAECALHMYVTLAQST